MTRQLGQDPTPLGGREDLGGYLLEGAKPRSRWGVGIEYERLGVFAESGETVPFAGDPSVETVLRNLAEQHGWQPRFEADHVVELQRGSAAVSLEPGAQLELAGSVHQELPPLRAELCGILREVEAVSRPLGISWLAIGLNPFTPVERIGWIPKDRYRIMSARLARRGRLAHTMMKATAGIQGNFDFSSEQDAMRKLRAAMGITSLTTALAANSPLYVGKPNGFQTMRGFVWLDTDPDRCGLLELAFRPESGIEAYVDYALAVPMLFLVRDGRWIDMQGYTFGRFLAEGREDWRATRADWALHLTTLFPEVRLKRYLEVRGADSAPADVAVGLMALWKGILYSDSSLDDAWRLVADWSWAERQQLHRDVCTHGLEAKIRGVTARDLVSDLTEIAATGLREQGIAGEPELLTPLRAILPDPEMAQARRLLSLWEGSFRRDRSRLVGYASAVESCGQDAVS